MAEYVIKQRQPGTGSIYSLSSDQYDRHIHFSRDGRYAVVLLGYYGGEGYSVHATAEEAIAASARMTESGYYNSIIDQKGRYYEIWGDTLRGTGTWVDELDMY